MWIEDHTSIRDKTKEYFFYKSELLSYILSTASLRRVQGIWQTRYPAVMFTVKTTHIPVLLLDSYSEIDVHVQSKIRNFVCLGNYVYIDSSRLIGKTFQKGLFYGRNFSELPSNINTMTKLYIVYAYKNMQTTLKEKIWRKVCRETFLLLYYWSWAATRENIYMEGEPTNYSNTLSYRRKYLDSS